MFQSRKFCTKNHSIKRKSLSNNVAKTISTSIWTLVIFASRLFSLLLQTTTMEHCHVAVITADHTPLNAILLAVNANAKKTSLEDDVMPAETVSMDSPSVNRATVHQQHCVSETLANVFVHRGWLVKSATNANSTRSDSTKLSDVNCATVIRMEFDPVTCSVTWTMEHAGEKYIYYIFNHNINWMFIMLQTKLSTQYRRSYLWSVHQWSLQFPPLRRMPLQPRRSNIWDL